MSTNSAVAKLAKNTLRDAVHLNRQILTNYLLLINSITQAKLTGKPDLSSESFFWQREFERWNREGRYKHGEPKMATCKKSIWTCLLTLQQRFQKPLKIVEVGCGPVSQFWSSKLDGLELQILTVDPLARVYTQLHKQYKTGYNLTCIEGYGETLNRMFKSEEFHLVYSQNAIDHSQDPKVFVRNLEKITKKGGLMILHGFLNEGTNAGWLGLHQWNLNVDGDSLILSNRTGSIRNECLTQGLPLSVVDCKVENTMFTIIYEKLSS
jgi:hypothetical protein